MLLPASLAPPLPLRNCPFLVQFIFLVSYKLLPDFRMSEFLLISEILALDSRERLFPRELGLNLFLYLSPSRSHV